MDLRHAPEKKYFSAVSAKGKLNVSSGFCAVWETCKLDGLIPFDTLRLTFGGRGLEFIPPLFGVILGKPHRRF